MKQARDSVERVVDVVIGALHPIPFPPGLAAINWKLKNEGTLIRPSTPLTRPAGCAAGSTASAATNRPRPRHSSEVKAAIQRDCLLFGTQVVLELLKLGCRRTLQLHIIQPFQNEGRLFAIGREQGIKRILGLVQVAQRLGPSSGREGSVRRSGRQTALWLPID